MILHMRVMRIVLKLLEQGFAASIRSSFAGSTAPELDGWIPSQRNIKLFDSARTHFGCAQQNRQRLQSKKASKAPTRRTPEKANKLGVLIRLALDLARSLVRAFGPWHPKYLCECQDSVTAAFVYRRTRGSGSSFRR